MSNFILRASKPLAPNQAWYAMQNLQDENSRDICITPTVASIEKGWLEWVIPDTRYNRTHIRQYYSNFMVLEEGEIPPEIPPEVITKKVELEVPVAEKPTLEKIISNLPGVRSIKNPIEVKRLKVSLMKKLDAIGVEYPKNATLKILQAVCKENNIE